MRSDVTQGYQPYQPYQPYEQVSQAEARSHRQNNTVECPQLPGTILRIFIPAGAVINLLNLIEVSSPSGICLVVRIPFLGNNGLDAVVDSIKKAGGKVEFVNS